MHLIFVCLKEFRQIEVKGFDASLFQTTQVFYSSKDGTKIPMFIVHRKVKLSLITSISRLALLCCMYVCLYRVSPWMGHTPLCSTAMEGSTSPSLLTSALAGSSSCRILVECLPWLTCEEEGMWVGHTKTHTHTHTHTHAKTHNPYTPREYGDNWHKQGIFEKKQNVFDDFIAAAEYLIEKKYTNQRK